MTLQWLRASQLKHNKRALFCWDVNSDSTMKD